MKDAIARLTLGGNAVHVGTAWLCCQGYALTAAHCVGNRQTQQLDPGPFHLGFPWGTITLLLSAVQPHFDLDVALLTLPGAQVPTTVRPLRLGPPPDDLADPNAGGRGWYSYGFPKAHPAGLSLTGQITDLAGVVDLSPAMQLLCDQGGQDYLQGASGAPVCHGTAAAGIIRYGVLNQRVIFATRTSDVVRVFPQLSACNAAEAGPALAHPLLAFPRGPIVPFFWITDTLPDTYAELYTTPVDAALLLGKVNRLVLEADPADQTVRPLRPAQFPLMGNVGPENYWRTVFLAACGQGPRMLAALLLVQPDTVFSANAKRNRLTLLNQLAGLQAQAGSP